MRKLKFILACFPAGKRFRDGSKPTFLASYLGRSPPRLYSLQGMITQVLLGLATNGIRDRYYVVILAAIIGVRSSGEEDALTPKVLLIDPVLQCPSRGPGGDYYPHATAHLA